MCRNLCLGDCGTCCRCCVVFENRHGRKRSAEIPDKYCHIQAKGHLDILERPKELRLRLDVLKQSEERLNENKKEQAKYGSLLDFFDGLHRKDKLKDIIDMDIMGVEDPQ